MTGPLVPAQAPDFPEDDVEEITGAIRDLLLGGDLLTLGRHGERFEAEFAAQHGGRLASAVNSGTAALEAILTAVDVRGGEVVVPANTFAATAFAVVRAGARPVFADIRPDLTVDPDDVARRITPRTRAVVTVHVGGLISPATPALAALCERHGVPLVEDAAHAHGSTLDGRPAGSFGVGASFSFFATKVMTTGEGGMVVTRDEDVHRTVRLLRDQGKLGGNRHGAIGANWRLSELHAIVGLTQVRRLPAFVAARRAVAERYRQGLSGLPGLTVLPEPGGARSCYYKFVALLDGPDPAALRTALAADGVVLGGAVYDLPLHLQPVFAPYADGPLPVAEDLCRRHVCPPIYPSLTDEQIDVVIASFKSRLDELA